jgi:hypothetical protein
MPDMPMLSGKPPVLVNAGWSLELAEPVKKAQHTLGSLTGVLGPSEEDDMNSYNFTLKISDV